MKGKRFFGRLMGFELRKSFFTPMMLLFLVALLGMNYWKLNAEYDERTSLFAQYASAYEDRYACWSGTLTPEKMGNMMEILAPLQEKFNSRSLSSMPGSGVYTDTEFDDYLFLSDNFADEMQFDYLYPNTVSSICQKAQQLVALGEKTGNSYEVRKNTKIFYTFAGRQIPAFADTRWIEVWLEHDYSSMVILLLCIFGLSPVFVIERETQMHMLMRTTRRGGGWTAAAKLTASLLFVAGICVLFYGMDIGVLGLRSGHWEALRSPVYAMAYLAYTPLNMSIGSFMLWSMLVKGSGIISMSCIILLLSCLCRRVLITFISSFGMVVILTGALQLSRIKVACKWFNPMELVMVRELLPETRFANLFGQPMPFYGMMILGVAVVTAALIVCILVFHPGRAVRGRKNAKI